MTRRRLLMPGEANATLMRFVRDSPLLKTPALIALAVAAAIFR